jgi:DNA-binding transcriptional LysR family regulator
MNLQDLRAFVAVAELGSVSRASVKLGLTQPAVTRRIQSFEQALGEPVLFDRSVKPAVLTGLGSRVLDSCLRILSELDELEEIASNDRDPAGTLRIGVAHGLEELLLSSALNRLSEEYKRLRLQISSDWTAGLIATVRSGALDCAVALLSTTHSVPAGVASTFIAQDEIVIVSARRSARPPGAAAWRLQDLQDDQWILNPSGCGCRKALCAAFDQQGLQMSIGAEVHGEPLQLSLIIQSGGIGLVPLRQLSRSGYQKLLNVLLVDDFHMTATISLLHKENGGRFSTTVKILVSNLQQIQKQT